MSIINLNDFDQYKVFAAQWKNEKIEGITYLYKFENGYGAIVQTGVDHAETQRVWEIQFVHFVETDPIHIVFEDVGWS